MAKRKTKLKNMKLTSVDLCRRGANPEAAIALYKSADGKGGESRMNFWERMNKAFGRVTGEELDNDVLKQLAEETGGYTPSDEADLITKAMGESLQSILSDETLTADAREDLLQKSVEEFNDEISKARRRWVREYDDENEDDDFDGTDDEDEPEPEDEGSDPYDRKFNGSRKKGGIGKMEIDVNKMSAEDKASLDALIAKYAPDKDGEGVNKPAENPEVKKALDEIAELKKSLEIEKMEHEFQKYAIIGKKADEEAKRLYELKKSNEEAYNTVIQAYDGMLSVANQSGIFKEYGTSRSADGTTGGKIEAKAAELRKADPALSYAASIVKACDENPELKAEFEGN